MAANPKEFDHDAFVKRVFRSRGSDPEPNNGKRVSIPIGCGVPDTLENKLARMVRQAMEAEKQDEFESYEEANDFEPDQDEDERLLDMSRYTLLELPDDEPLEAFLSRQTPSEAPEQTIGDEPNPDAQEPHKASGESPDA